MLAYKEFLEEVQKELPKYLPGAFQGQEIQIRETYKNNVKLQGITLSNESETICPVLYLNEYYKNMYQENLSMEAILHRIAQDYQWAEEQKPEIAVSSFHDPETWLPKLITRVVNAERNVELLKEVPHLLVNDLAVYPVSKIREDMTLKITNTLCESVGLDPDMVLTMAMKNRTQLEPPVFKSMEEIIREILDMDEEMKPETVKSEEEESLTMYVLTNQDRNWGASYIADKQLLSAIGKFFDKDFYILPSSVHEVILLPKSEEMEPEYLREMVLEVNRTEVGEKDLLSDNVYQFDRERCEVLMYDGTHMERERVQAMAEPLKAAGKSR